ncbi:cytochrome p450 domain-containing protein [Phthorimaea operculella]|nr:cytochrome p450 domain-containing protein [Phthorimaea operculella]
MSVSGVFLFSQYMESFWSSPPPLVDWSGVPTLVLGLVALVALVTALVARAPDVKPVVRLPGPPALPFFGTRWIFWSRYRMNKLHEAYEDMFRRYGTVFMESSPSGAPVVSIADRDALETVLRAPAKRPYRPPTEIVQVYRRSRPDRYASTGLVNEQGEKWYHLRKNLTAELTSPQTIQGFVPQLNSICDDFLELLRSCRRPDGAVAGFDQLTNRVGLECEYETDTMRPEFEPDKPTDHSGFEPQLNSICDDFLELLRSASSLASTSLPTGSASSVSTKQTK